MKKDRPTNVTWIAGFIILATSLPIAGGIFALQGGMQEMWMWFHGLSIPWVIVWNLVFLIGAIGLLRGNKLSYLLLLVLIPIRVGFESLVFDFRPQFLMWIAPWAYLLGPEVSGFFRRTVDN